MIETRNRERLLNALIFFSENTHNAGKTKLFKLLHALDFNHFLETGLSVTGLSYKAYDRGPVPDELYQEWKSPKLDFNQALTKRSHTYPSGVTGQKLEPKVDFNEVFFSPYQLDLMDSLAKKYFSHTAEEMTNDSHKDFTCWDEIYNVRGMHSAEIPYELILERRNSEEDQRVDELSKEYKALLHNYK